jgi:hypothetical protein
LRLGLSGRLTQATIGSPLTPLFLLAALTVGLIALMVIPREEEPQISVPMVDIVVRADGLKAPDAVELVTKPLEAIVKAIDGVEHVYSQTNDDRVMVTARFFVGTKAEDAILRVHERIRANFDRIPVGIPEPLIVGRGINDVAIVTLTLSPKPEAAERYTDKDLYEIADQLRSELMKVDNVGLSYISGGSPQQIRVEPDPEKLSLYAVTLAQLVAKVQGANRSFLAGEMRGAGTTLSVAAGQTLTGVPDIGLLLVSTRDSRPVYVRDVANVVIGPSPLEHRVWADAIGPGRLDSRAGGHCGIRQTARRQRGCSWGGFARPPRYPEGSPHPRERRFDGDPRLRRDRQRKGQRIVVSPGPRDAVDRRADLVRDRLAGSGSDPRRHSDYDPAHDVCCPPDGLHHQPGQPVRPHLLDRHSGR